MSEVKEELVTLVSDTLMGDLRDAILDRLRAMPKPWTVMSEAEQRDMISGVHRVASHLVDQAVTLIAANGQRTIRAMVYQCVIKDEMKIVLKANRHDAQRLEMIDAVGSVALIAFADREPFMGERGPAKPDPDQPPLVLDDGTVIEHSNVKPMHGKRKKDE